MFKDIIAAITPSAECECAADAAMSFAQRFDANLTMLHVCGVDRCPEDMEFMSRSGENEKIRANIEAYYAEKLKGVDKHKVVVTPGVPHIEILRLARKLDPDLIVMGPHTTEYAERRAMMWNMSGSTVEKVSQQARCPVMIVTREAPYGERRIANIVVATDFSSQADCAVNYGGQLARQYKAGLTVFNVVDIDGEGGSLSKADLAREVGRRTEWMDQEYGPRLRGISACAFECWDGKPGVEILKLAKRRDADLVIMAHHSREKDPEKAMLGSTVVQVAMNSLCPTMSVNRHFDLRCGLMYDQTGAVAETAATATV
jgi:nucleotide-binding universal stress UspA family protein